jgi:hypothetical protein
MKPTRALTVAKSNVCVSITSPPLVGVELQDGDIDHPDKVLKTLYL